MQNMSQQLSKLPASKIKLATHIANQTTPSSSAAETSRGRPPPAGAERVTPTRKTCRRAAQKSASPTLTKGSVRPGWAWAARKTRGYALRSRQGREVASRRAQLCAPSNLTLRRHAGAHAVKAQEFRAATLEAVPQRSRNRAQAGMNAPRRAALALRSPPPPRG